MTCGRSELTRAASRANALTAAARTLGTSKITRLKIYRIYLPGVPVDGASVPRTCKICFDNCGNSQSSINSPSAFKPVFDKKEIKREKREKKRVCNHETETVIYM